MHLRDYVMEGREHGHPRVMLESFVDTQVQRHRGMRRWARPSVGGVWRSGGRAPWLWVGLRLRGWSTGGGAGALWAEHRSGTSLPRPPKLGSCGWSMGGGALAGVWHAGAGSELVGVV